jgi:flagellar hook-associated protein 1 FlgK
MASNILSIGKSALAAAQAGIATAGHNIANASTPGYSRQVVVQSTAQPQDFGYGFLGQGTQISTVRRVYSDFLGRQVVSAQSAKNELDSHYAQIRQVDNLLADSSTGLAPALQDFFNGLHDLASNPTSNASRQAVISSGDALAARFQLLSGRIEEIQRGVNSEITSSIDAINSYVQQIAQLNRAIEQASGSHGNPANDLLDQRDQLVNELGKEVKLTVIKQDGGAYNVLVANGQPLVVGGDAYALSAGRSAADPTRVEPRYESNGVSSPLGDQSSLGGRLGGLVEFQTNTLNGVQNSLGRIAIGLAASFNSQHRLGQDLDGVLGADFFAVGEPLVNASRSNGGTAVISAAVVDASVLSSSDYDLSYDGTAYLLTRLEDGATQSFSSLPQTVEGVSLSLSAGAPAAGDHFLIRPTATGASSFSLALRDIDRIAAAAPVRIASVAGNTGTAKVSAAAVDATYLAAGTSLPVVLSFDAASNSLSGFPAGMPVSVTVGGATTTFPPGTPVSYADGAEIAFGGIRFQVSGIPGNGDRFSVSSNSNGVGDNRNALLLANLQSARTLGGGTATYEGAFAQLVSLVGNKTRELETTTSAAEKMLSEASAAQQAQSGVNLDEEAANLLRYQQAYQAAGKVIQVANEVFDVILALND